LERIVPWGLKLEQIPRLNLLQPFIPACSCVEEPALGTLNFMARRWMAAKANLTAQQSTACFGTTIP
jgi:hypothetical protein